MPELNMYENTTYEIASRLTKQVDDFLGEKLRLRGYTLEKLKNSKCECFERNITDDGNIYITEYFVDGKCVLVVKKSHHMVNSDDGLSYNIVQTLEIID